MGGQPDDVPAPRTAHRIGIYTTDEFLVGAVVEFVRSALEDAAMAVVVLPSAVQQEVERALVAAGIDVTAARARGDHVAVDADEFCRELTTSGALDVSGYELMAKGMVEAAVTRGRELRVCGNMHSILWEAGEIATVLELEGIWNVLPETPPFRLLCLYASHVFGGDDDSFLALCERHATVSPVEDFGAIVDTGNPDRTVSLLEHQERDRQHVRADVALQREEIALALDRSMQQALAQQDQFERMVASRDIIGQAKGIIMVRWRIDADAAFEMLRGASNRSHRRLQEVAAAVVEQQLRGH